MKYDSFKLPPVFWVIPYTDSLRLLLLFHTILPRPSLSASPSHPPFLWSPFFYPHLLPSKFICCMMKSTQRDNGSHLHVLLTSVLWGECY